MRIYESIHASYPTDAVPYYRHGMTARGLGRVTESIGLFKKGMSLLSTDPKIKAGHWLHPALPRNLGFSYWRLAEDLKDDPKQTKTRLEYLKQAIEFGEIACRADVPDDLERLKTVNNLTYFVWQYLSLQQRRTRTVTKARLAELVEKLQEIVNDAPEYVNAWETLCVAYKLLNKNKKSLNAADQTLRVLYKFALERSGRSHLDPSEVAAFLRDDERPTFESALNEILKGHGLKGEDG